MFKLTTDFRSTIFFVTSIFYFCSSCYPLVCFTQVFQFLVLNPPFGFIENTHTHTHTLNDFLSLVILLPFSNLSCFSCDLCCNLKNGSSGFPRGLASSFHFLTFISVERTTTTKSWHSRSTRHRANEKTDTSSRSVAEQKSEDFFFGIIVVVTVVVVVASAVVGR